MRLIDGDALIESMGVSNAVKWGNKDGYQQDKSYSTLMRYEIKDYIDSQPTVDAVPIKAISVWLAAYAAPPKYAIDEIAGTDPGRIVTVDTLVNAWEYHWKYLMECGLLQEEQNGTDNP